MSRGDRLVSDCPALGESDTKLAQRLIQVPDFLIETICERLVISSATLYQQVAPDGSRRKSPASGHTRWSRQPVRVEENKTRRIETKIESIRER
jgi:hypothetical protein